MKNNSIKKMKLLYVAPRYHTNQVPVMRGFSKEGCKIMFLAQYEGVGEVHDGVEFKCLKQGLLSYAVANIIEKLNGPNQAESKRMRCFIPAFFHTLKVIKEFSPDLVIIRERYFTCIVIYGICKMLRIKKVVLYVQQPIYDFTRSTNKIKRYLKTILFPTVAFSPVLYHGKEREKREKSDVFFVPLVMAEDKSSSKKAIQYFQNGKIHFLDVGKYREYKNHFFLVDALSNIRKQVNLSNVQLTIIGQVSNQEEEDYFERLQQYVAKKSMEDVITLHINIPFAQMEDLYLRHDCLLLPSTYESAGMVILEAMKMGLCVAASINCGLSSYLDEYQCGYTFGIDGTHELESILMELIENRDRIMEMGQASIRIVEQHLQFYNYVECLDKLTSEKFDFSLYEDDTE